MDESCFGQCPVDRLEQPWVGGRERRTELFSRFCLDRGDKRFVRAAAILLFHPV